MIPVDQAHWHPDDPLGDCLAACVASIFERPLAEVPDFMAAAKAAGDGDWLSRLWTWCLQEYEGVLPAVIYYPGRKWERRFRARPLGYHPGFWIAVVESRVVKEEAMHAVVMSCSSLAHDPNRLSRENGMPYRFAGELSFECWNGTLLPRTGAELARAELAGAK